MTTITKVAIAGASGALGAPVFEQLLKADFQLTVLTRKGSNHTWPSNVTVKEVDYNSVDSLTEALRGQDAVVSTITTESLTLQSNLIDAAVKTGVKRFIPSEFGSNTFNKNAAKLPCYAPKVQIQEALQKAAAESDLTWTAVLNGAFLDWVIRAGFFADVKNRTIELPDGGNNLTSSTTLPTIGKAVVGVLKNPEQTKNRPVYVQEAAISLKQIEEILKKHVGADGWKENVTSLDEILKNGLEEIGKTGFNPNAFFSILKVGIWGKEYGGHFDKLDNELLGIKQLSPEEVEAIVVANIPK
ncbi:NAD(P)-binding protein [Daldinia caldariorum]|uniref:NAD(P)-binding protein n=1 Tax=Daldinia caldariorum TaxID=326644 RepID=UPI00200874C8|nr:NAD(P)-binding protein [Daldinia caldariorum]KAI1468314.1 NAD(P)-binding protein [Daldinia caldariorum]